MAGYYTVRVELKGSPTYQQYENLHAVMLNLGYSRSITSSDGKVFALPHATYYGYSVNDVASVRDLVSTAVRTSIQPSIVVFVAETQGWAIAST